MRISLLLLIGVFFGLTGCSHLKQDSLMAKALRDRLEDYHQCVTLDPLKVPEGTTAVPTEDAMPIPQ